VRDPYNPNADDLRQWAYTPDAIPPHQDWHLFLRDTGYERLFMEFVADRNCPNRSYFLDVLYYIAGSIHRSSSLSTETRHLHLRQLAYDARENGNFWLSRFADRIDALIAGRENFDFDLWCSGKYAYEQPG
jgi:hypothetical protein